MFGNSKCIQKNNITFNCPHCFHSISAKNFENHCSSIHKLDIARLCVWCFGYENRSNHPILKCFESFLQSLETHPTQKVQLPNRMDLNNDVTNENVDDNLPRDAVWEVKLDISGITYLCERLNLAVACFQWFVKVRYETDWYHIIVEGSRYPSFVKAMNNEEGKMRTLPFSCICKVNDRGSLHKHFILVVLKGSFRKDVWKMIQKQKVQTPLDLLRAMGLLSRGKPLCNGHTVFTANPLPPLYSLVLAVQWDGGLMEVLHETYNAIDPTLLLPGACSFNGLWGIKIHDLPGITSHLSLPVSEDFHPTVHPTDYFVYLTRGRKLFFERVLSGVNMHTKNRNIFFDAIGDEIYYPTPFQQKCIQILRPLTERIAELECLTEGTEQQINLLENSLKRMKERNIIWKRQCKTLQEKITRLQNKRISEMEREIDILRMENVKFKKQKFFHRASL